MKVWAALENDQLLGLFYDKVEAERCADDYVRQKKYDYEQDQMNGVKLKFKYYKEEKMFEVDSADFGHEWIQYTVDEIEVQKRYGC